MFGKIKPYFKNFKCLRNFSSSGYCLSNKNILIDRHLNMTLISINQKSKRNCLNRETLFQLRDAITSYDDDNSSNIAILYGEGGNFCSGFDIDEIIEKGYEKVLEPIKDWADEPICKKPIIAAIHGHTVAEGFELALACDLRVIEDTASMGFLGRRFGSPLLLNGPKRLSQLIGVSRAMDLVLTGRPISGNIADEWGLAARNVSTGTAVGQAVNLATSIGKYLTNSVQYDKLAIYRACMEGNQAQAICKKFDEKLETLRKLAVQDINQNAIRFKEGIGRHGNFKKLVAKEIPSWEETENEIDNRKL